MSAQDLVRKVTDTVGSLMVMQRAGVLSFPRVDHTVSTLLAVRKYGPFAGPVHADVARGLEAIAIIDERGAVSYRNLEGMSNALVRAWQADGIRPGTVLGVMARNHRGLVLTMLASAKLGTKLVLMNTGLAPRQLADIAARENVETFVFDSEFAAAAAALPEGTRTYLSWQDELVPGAPAIDSLLYKFDRSPVPAPSEPGGFVLLTSGTTGTPKGAPRGRTSPFTSAQFLDRVPLRRGQRMLMAAPAFHGTGVSQMAMALALGQTVIMARRFDPLETLRLIEGERANVLVVVPTMLQRILDLGIGKIAEFDTSSLKIIFAAGSALSPDLCRRTREAFGDVLHNLYGSTECAVATVATPEDLRRAPGTAGRPPVSCRVEILDDAGNPVTEPGVSGRIFAASGLSFEGYTDGRDKERIRGLLSTGDVGHWDADGYLFVDGRDDDMIISGGENVYPLEVENLLVERDDVLDAAVVGVEDPEFGARLRAFVVPTPTAARDPEEIKAYVKANLARYKVPRDVIFLEELPRNTTGKLLRRVLVDMEI
ncbi:acyl-CoA synthetase [Rhodococcus sp. NPDC003382]